MGLMKKRLEFEFDFESKIRNSKLDGFVRVWLAEFNHISTITATDLPTKFSID